MIMNAPHYGRAAPGLISFLGVGLLLGRNVSLYHLEEILICWLFFSLAFVSLALIVLAGFLVFCAGECVIHWVTMIPGYRHFRFSLRACELYSGIVGTEDQQEFQPSNSE